MADTNEDSIIRIGGSGDTRTRDELIDDMALPFLDMAEKIEAARLNGADADAWRAVFETNLFLWRFIGNFLPRHFSEDVSPEMTELLQKIGNFMTKVTVAMLEEEDRDDALLDKVVKLNLNMCDQILALRNAPQA